MVFSYCHWHIHFQATCIYLATNIQSSSLNGKFVVAVIVVKEKKYNNFFSLFYDIWDRKINVKSVKVIVFRKIRASCQFARKVCHRLVFPCHWRKVPSWMAAQYRKKIHTFRCGCIYQAKITLKCISKEEKQRWLNFKYIIYRFILCIYSALALNSVSLCVFFFPFETGSISYFHQSRNVTMWYGASAIYSSYFVVRIHLMESYF